MGKSPGWPGGRGGWLCYDAARQGVNPPLRAGLLRCDAIHRRDGAASRGAEVMVPFLVLQTLPRPSVFSPRNALLTLARNLDRSRFVMTVAVPRHGLLSEALEREGIQVVRIAGLRTYRRHDALWRLPTVVLRIARLASRLGTQLLVSNHAELGPFADAAARLHRIPWICFLRQADRSERYYEKYRIARSNAVAAVSAAALHGYRAYLARKGLSANTMQVIPTGIEIPVTEK